MRKCDFCNSRATNLRLWCSCVFNTCDKHIVGESFAGFTPKTELDREYARQDYLSKKPYWEGIRI